MILKITAFIIIYEGDKYLKITHSKTYKSMLLKYKKMWGRFKYSVER